jgi:hypothetical protein
MTENSEQKQPHWQFQKGASGNPAGKPKGALNHATRAARLLLDGEGENITRKCIEMALAGESTALRLCIERFVPPRKDLPISFVLPEISNGQHLSQAAIGLLQAVADGGVTPVEAGNVMRLIEGVGKAIELGEIEARIAALEARSPK